METRYSMEVKYYQKNIRQILPVPNGQELGVGERILPKSYAYKHSMRKKRFGVTYKYEIRSVRRLIHNRYTCLR